jgi:integrase
LELPILDGVTRAKPSTRVPVVFTVDEASQVISYLQPPFSLMGKLQYGAGLRLLECVRLRVKDIDIDLEYKTITVRNGKGRKDRVRLLPDSAVDDLRLQLHKSKELHAFDQQADLAQFIYLLHRKENTPEQTRSGPGNMYSLQIVALSI